MLLVFLHSVAASNPGARVSVYWQDIPERLLAGLRAVSPHADFVRTEFDFAGDPIQRISSKVLCWARAAEENERETELVFCDSDTLVRSDLSGFFASDEADVVFTTKPENVPLNSGVMLARGGAAATAFFRAWRDETVRILKTPEIFAQANDEAQPYGGTDQMSLHQMLGYERGREAYTVTCGGLAVRLRAEPCARLNETNSRPLSDEIHVVHYKAGWQAILLRGRPFSRFRPRAESWEMLTLFLETLTEAIAAVNAATGSRFTPRDWGIQWPWYYNGAGRFSAAGYVAWRAKEAAKRAWLMMTGRLEPGM